MLIEPITRNFNIGDEIITRCAKKGLKPITKGNYVYSISKFDAQLRGKDLIKVILRRKSSIYTQTDLRFVVGTNLLSTNMQRIYRPWNIELQDTIVMNNIITFGVGLGKDKNYNGKVNSYTKLLYNRALSHEYIHSVRDNNTKEFLEGLGFKVINTGCPTLWLLTEDVCKKIPHEKSDSVIFTLVDYDQDPVADKLLIGTLKSNYDNVFFWPQSLGDIKYFNKICNDDSIHMIPPALSEYEAFLNSRELDYVGNRLHGGIFAMQNGVRSIIIGVDNRAEDMNKDYNINMVPRSEIEKLDEKINQSFETKIELNHEGIQEWLNQFDI